MSFTFSAIPEALVAISDANPASTLSKESTEAAKSAVTVPPAINSNESTES